MNAATAGISLREGREPLAVEGVGAVLLAQPDGDHLEQAALDRPGEVGVRLDPVDGITRSALDGVAVENTGHAALDLAEPDRLHARPDRAADRCPR